MDIFKLVEEYSQNRNKPFSVTSDEDEDGTPGITNMANGIPPRTPVRTEKDVIIPPVRTHSLKADSAVSVKSTNVKYDGKPLEKAMPRRSSIVYLVNEIEAPDIVHRKDPAELTNIIQIYKRDNSKISIECGLTTTTEELCQLMAEKQGISDPFSYKLYVVMHYRERLLNPKAQPLAQQKRWLEQIGYTEEEVCTMGKSDNSYYFKFIFSLPSNLSVLPINKGEVRKHIDLQGTNLSTIPPALYDTAPSLLTLNCSNNNAIDFPTEFVKRTTAIHDLKLARNEYKSVPLFLHPLSSLMSIDLSLNKLRNLNDGDLHKILGLKVLRLNGNLLKSLPNELTQLKMLTSLYLSNNLFTEFPKCLYSIESLTFLDLSFNTINEISEDIGNLINLQNLVLASNRISGGLPKSFEKLLKLKELDVRHNLLQSIDGLPPVKDLELLLEGNKISHIQFRFQDMTHFALNKNHLLSFEVELPLFDLVELNLSYNKLPQLADDIFNRFPLLELLNLDSNELVAIPKSIANLTKLLHFSACNNAITAMPVGLNKLTLLRTLNLRNNNLKDLPTEIWSLNNLVTLNLSSNLLKNLPEVTKNSLLSFLPTRTRFFGGGNATTTTDDSLKNESSNIPLAKSLENLYLADNCLTDAVFSRLVYFLKLKILNLSYNEIYDIPKNAFYNFRSLNCLYLSGNNITSLLAEEISRVPQLRELYLNFNKLQTLPADIAKLSKLKVLDVSSNNLKYNVCNWPYDWNWNWNRELSYLNLSDNKRLEIKGFQKDLADFSNLSKLHMLGLMDVTVMVATPEPNPNLRVRLSSSDLEYLRYGIADSLGKSKSITTWDLVVPRFRKTQNECLVALFDGCLHSKFGSSAISKMLKYIQESMSEVFADQLVKHQDIEKALRNCFLELNRRYGLIDKGLKTGASAVVAYVKGTDLYIANVGNSQAVLSRSGGAAEVLSTEHIPWVESELTRIHQVGGNISHQGLVNNELEISRCFGNFHLLPSVNANPNINHVKLCQEDEFLILANKQLWEYLTPQIAVDVARQERNRPMIAAQKIRDFAIAYGAEESTIVMVLKINDAFDKQRLRKSVVDPNVVRYTQEQEDMWKELQNSKTKKGSHGDSTLARLDNEVPAPKGLVALVFTDIKNSTHLWETIPKGMQSAIKIHNKIMRRYLRSTGGYEVKTEGDAFMVCFPAVSSALLWCLTCQLQLLTVDWPHEVLESVDGAHVYSPETGELIFRGLSVRMGIHWGAPVCEEDPITGRMDYFGPMVNKAARISGIADGGQITLSTDAVKEIEELCLLLQVDEESLDKEHQLLRREIDACKRLDFQFVNIGEHKLKGMEHKEAITLVYPRSLLKRYEYVTFHQQSQKLIETEVLLKIGLLAYRIELMCSNVAKQTAITYLKQEEVSLANVIKPNLEEMEMLRRLESYITRLENSLLVMSVRLPPC